MSWSIFVAVSVFTITIGIPEMPTFKNQKQYSEREKTVFWPKKKYFVKNNEGEGANCIAANLSFKKKVHVLLSLK